MGVDGDAGDASGAVAAEATLNVRCSNGTKFTVQTSLDAAVAAFKATVAEQCDVPAEQQRLIYRGRILKDDQTLQSYGLESDHTIHLVRGASPPTSVNTPSTNPNSNSGVARDSSNTGGVGLGASLEGSLFPGFNLNGMGGTGGSSLFGSGFPEFDQVQQQLTQNPNMLREIMNMPAIQNMMNNPEIMRNLITSNPQMREIIDRNPDLAHILNDPNTLRQTLEAARNPELMREMMRNTDRAMSNIESSPEGFNMLRRLYETVQEPLLNATTMAGETGSNPFSALLANQGGNQSTSPNVTSTNSEATTGSSAPNANPLPNPWGTATNTRSNPSSNTRPNDVPGLGGLGIGDLNRTSGMLDSSQLNQIMQNPAMQQLMQSMLSDPQQLNQLLNFNPQTRALLESNSSLREMLTNPEILRQLSSPESLQQHMSLHQSIASLLSLQQSGREQNQAGTGTGTPNSAGYDLLMNMFGLGGSGLSAASNPNVPPEELYATQLSQLQEMGFFDTQENIRALIATAGNVNAAVERLLGNPGQ